MSNLVITALAFYACGAIYLALSWDDHEHKWLTTAFFCVIGSFILYIAQDQNPADPPGQTIAIILTIVIVNLVVFRLIEMIENRYRNRKSK